ncbi:MAG: MBL fold metallo-hydrolase [Lachnospiraceae bacterium]|nr:MBL fold metallo-hydrolase [Lachnospiraceae bacterium]
MSRIQIESMTLGPVAANCYLVKNQDIGELLIIDAAASPERIRQKICDMQAVPRAILLTHGHYDHIGAVEEIRREYEIPVYCMEPEEEVLESSRLNLSEMFGQPMTLKADQLLKDGQKLELAGLKLQALNTPGHTQGGGCYYFPENGILFSGDTLFCESVGRSDFPTGSASVLVRSIREKLLVLPDETKVYPGHNDTTAIGWERDYNPFIG